jgi:hypothetical protein
MGSPTTVDKRETLRFREFYSIAQSWRLPDSRVGKGSEQSSAVGAVALARYNDSAVYVLLLETKACA